MEIGDEIAIPLQDSQVDLYELVASRLSEFMAGEDFILYFDMGDSYTFIWSLPGLCHRVVRGFHDILSDGTSVTYIKPRLESRYVWPSLIIKRFY